MQRLDCQRFQFLDLLCVTSTVLSQNQIILAKFLFLDQKRRASSSTILSISWGRAFSAASASAVAHLSNFDLSQRLPAHRLAKGSPCLPCLCCPARAVCPASSNEPAQLRFVLQLGLVVRRPDGVPY